MNDSKTHLARTGLSPVSSSESEAILIASLLTGITSAVLARIPSPA